MPGSLDKAPGCPSLAVRRPQENRRRVGPFYKTRSGGMEGGTRIKNLSGGGASSYNERLTACKSCLTLELAPMLSTNLKKELGC